MYADAAFTRAIALKGLGRLAAALADYDRAITFRPTFADAFANRGVVLQELLRFDEALKSYDKDQRPLVSLLKSLAGVWRVVEQGESLPHFDLHCPLLSLPLAFKTSLATIPSAERYLEADAGKLSEWKARVGADSRLRVGLAWSGNKAHPNDGKRSIALAELLKGLPEEHHYVSLHKEVREADMKRSRRIHRYLTLQLNKLILAMRRRCAPAWTW